MTQATFNRVLRPFALASLSAALLCAASAKAEERPLVIGGSVSITGALAVDAAYHLHGIQQGIEDANAQGGWLGRKIELKYYDDKSDAGTAVRLYTKLITEDNVDLLIGPYSSGITQAVAPLINKYEKAMIEPEASVPDIYVPGNLWNIQGIAPSFGYLEGVLPLAKSHGAKTVAVLALKSAFSLACDKARLEQVKALDMALVYDTTYALPQPDFSSLALAIKNAQPDVVVVCSYYPDAVGIAQSLQRAGYAPKFFAEAIGPAEDEFTKALGPIANRIISNTSWWASLKTAGNAAFIAHYKATFHQDPDYHAASGYGAIQALGAALNAVKVIDQAKLHDWLLHNEVQTVQGTFASDPNGAAKKFNQFLFQIQDGTRKLIWPAADAEAPAQVPYTGQ
ncbi:MAG TPA: amino acid ABC transporter substrate-binding protein [Stellaceae bacterium]|nr:amino acid ABC transporter substrate-binding protein [Stellaceae bacterium]